MVEGEGLVKPITEKDLNSRYLQTFSQMPKGDLFVKFNIVFPKYLSNEQKKDMVSILKAN